MMRLGFGVTVLARCLASNGVDGIGNYTRELLKRLAVKDDIDLVPVSYGHPVAQFPDIPSNTLEFGGFASSVAFSVLSGMSFPGTSEVKKKVDLVHATDHLIPHHGKIPVVATLMDAIPLAHPEWVTIKSRKIKNAVWKRTTRWASHIITISEYSKREIEQYFGIESERISVTPLGVDERWFRPVPAELMDATMQRYGLPQNYFLFVGTLQPRKNIARVIEAYRSLPQGVRNEVPLVIVGRGGWQCEDIVEALNANSYGPTLVWLKHLPDADLLAVLKGATALVFPSLYEGFGLPVIESFAAGTPVITSNSTSLPEVAGDAALLVNPFDTQEIAAAMQLMLENNDIAESFSLKGRERALTYSWSRTVDMTLDVYKKTIAAT